MKKIYLILGLGLFGTAWAMDLDALRDTFFELLPNEQAGVAIAYIGPEEATEVFVGNPSFDKTTLFEYGSITKVLQLSFSCSW